MLDIFKEIKKDLIQKGFRFERTDFERPWGGFFVIEEEQSGKFLETYYPEQDANALTNGGNKISPKILIVLPNKRLSWQYHHRRSEVWKVIGGSVGVVRSLTDEETPLETYHIGEQITLACGERHRLIGLEEVGVIAEIWQHTEAENPSNEADIVRLQDDFGR